jgi:hypothetical protein
MKTLLINLSFFIIISVSTSWGEDRYRDYVNGIDASDHWFRIGSFEMKSSEGMREIDLFYTDSSKSPQDTEPRFWIVPNNFNLFCVWKGADGSWKHRKVFGGSRITFLRVTPSKSTDKIVLQLRGTSSVDEPPEEPKRPSEIRKEANAPFDVEVSFDDENPVAKPKAEQDAAGQPATPPRVGD